MGAGPFDGSSAQALLVPEEEKWALRLLLDLHFGIFG